LIEHVIANKEATIIQLTEIEIRFLYDN